MSANLTIQVPNPYAQMAWVTPPTNARYLTIKLYAEAGAVAVLFWDILLHIPQDYKILRKYRINFLAVVYVFSRLSTIAFVLGLTIVTTSPVGNCNLIRYIDFLYPLTVPLSILPFVPRVAAIYHNNRYVFAFFMCTWLAVLATSILWPFGVQGLKVGPTDFCVEIKLHSTASLAALVLLVHDSLIFLATSWAFVSRSYSTDSNNGIFNVMVLGKNLPKFTKLLLRDGQAYYLASLSVQVMFLSQYYDSSPFAFPCSFGNPSLVLTTNMAAYVYRNVRLGYYMDHTLATLALDEAVDRPSILSDRPQRVSVLVFDNLKSIPSTEPELSGSSSVHSHEEKLEYADGCSNVKVGTGHFEGVKTKVDV